MRALPGAAAAPPRSVARSLLGSDAYIQTGTARRVVPKKQAVVTGPLLNCTTESRRRATMAQALAGEALAQQAPDARLGAAAAVAAVVAIAAVAAVSRLCAVVAACAAYYFLVHKRPKRAQQRAPEHDSDSKGWAECWPSPERAPPLPLARLPDRVSDVEEAWMIEAKLAPRWTGPERRFLARCRLVYQTEFSAVPKYIDAYGDRRLLRVLRQDPARDEDLAVKKIGDYLAWRSKTDADGLRGRIVDEETGEPCEPLGWVHGPKMLECIRVIQTSTALYDRGGHAVCVYQAFHWPAPALRAHLCTLSREQLVEFAQSGAEYNAVQLERISLARERVILDSAKLRWKEGRGLPPPLRKEGWGELTRLCCVTDMAGCTFGSLMLPTLLPAFVQSVSLFINFYPGIVGELHVVNCAPVIARILKKALRSVVPKHIADQVKVHVDSTGLQGYLSPHMLPAQLGGLVDCAHLKPPAPPDANGNKPAAVQPNGDAR
ncbi:hypothetical protein M885DRAFT_524703 [Pelagophyceae sp. CCMP2097]|nr:hypothetical protein M885DRAFT_524703 [Pelagophyceae sp. CCMP2097]